MDSRAIYNELEDKAVIPPRKNAVTLSRVLPAGPGLQDSLEDSVRDYGKSIITTA